MVEITLNVTTRCNRRCTICADNSGPDGQDFTEEKTQKLIEKIAEWPKTKFFIHLTGGELLLNKQLPAIVKMMISRPNVRLALVTSGFLEKDQEEAERLGASVKDWSYKKFSVSVSFNDFQTAFPERLLATLRFLLKETPVRIIYIKVATTAPNIVITFKKLQKVLSHLTGLATGNYLLPYLVWPSQQSHFRQIFDNRVFSREKMAELKAVSLSYRTRYICFTENNSYKGIEINPGTVVFKGRARNLDKALSGNFFIITMCDTLKNRHRRSLCLNADGSWYPGCECPPVAQLQLGGLDDNWSTILRRRGRLAKAVLPKIIADRDATRDNVCRFCQRAALEIIS